MARSRASFAVPVLTATGRCWPLGPVADLEAADQIGFWLGSVLPGEDVVTRNAACGLTAWTPASGSGAW